MNFLLFPLSLTIPSSVCVSEPLDTIKVRLQSSPPSYYRNSFDCLIRTVRSEGLRSLYKGMASPLLGNAPLNAIVFGCNGHMNRLLDKQFPSKHSNSGVKTPEYARLYLSATWGGIAQCVIATPVELIKCKMQVQGMNGNGLKVYSSSFDCARQTFLKGGIRGLYRGWWSTLARDGPSYGAWFVAFEFCRYHLTPPNTVSSTPVLLVAGGLAGIATWLSTYPFDVLKSVVQTLPENTPSNQLKMSYIAKIHYRQHGFKWFFTGLGPTLVRAVPVSAVTFYVFEKCLDLFGRDRD